MASRYSIYAQPCRHEGTESIARTGTASSLRFAFQQHDRLLNWWGDCTVLKNDQTLCEVHLALSVGSVGPGKAAEVFMSMFEIEDAMEKLLSYDKNNRLFMELFGILFLYIC